MYTLTPKSGLFLAGSCFTAIAAVGSVFELAYGKPVYGFLATGIILALTTPLTGWLFWAAVQDTKAHNK